jgi:hypothetical protein
MLIHTGHPMLCDGLEKSLSEWHGTYESHMDALCKSSGKDTSGMAWQGNSMGTA